MSKRIINPYSVRDDYNCFGCSPDNPIGLHLTFREENDEIVSDWTPGPDFAGWINVLHGGIQATLMDEIASWYVFTKLNTAGVTRQMDVKYRKAVLISDGPITLRASLKEVNRSLATFAVKLFSKGELRAEATIVYYLYSSEDAQQKFFYPGSDAFYSQT